MIPLERWSRPGLAALRPRYCQELGEWGPAISNHPGLDLSDSGVRVGVIEITKMPPGLFLHVRHALPLDCAGNDAARFLPLIVRPNAAQEFGCGGEVMPVDLMNLPSEGPPFVG